MSTTPQMSQSGQQQQGPSTAPPQEGQQQAQQQFGPQQGMQGQGAQGQGMQGQGAQGQGMQGQGMQAGGQGIQHMPPQLRRQIQQLGQQQPFQHLLQQFGQEQQSGQGQQQGLGQQIPQAQAPEISTQALASNVATAFWDVIEPLPGQPSTLYLYVDDSWRAFIDPSPHTHDEVQEAFAFGQQVIGYYDSANPAYLLAIVVAR
ncbi:hypothetical protein DMA15_06705 [Streptomyces sp. WAC 01529]|uniref:hypothetical protein n=1 Tax=Streptomyces sp. WAC 01529 TaxID=2203205 RepID=UPI000F6BDA60|nr:hypothetical protein [Streptomyces sp. WAC 01529]AZM52327.1 hypothetical protein DMA15_06705 [Streptomyces sp. WAC 01529]